MPLIKGKRKDKMTNANVCDKDIYIYLFIYQDIKNKNILLKIHFFMEIKNRIFNFINITLYGI